MILGNDISSYQGDVNYDIYKNNSNFVICKATEGNGFVDPKLARNQSEARRVGLPLGYYHFARPDLGNDPAHEADWFLSKIGKLNEGELLCLDYEANWDGDVVGWCKNWLDRVKFMTGGCQALIYLNQSLAQGKNWEPIAGAGYGLWIAAYTYDPNTNNYQIGAWSFAAMQQWSNQQIVPGIAGGVDANVFFGDLASFKKYGYHVPVPPTPPTPTPPPTPPTPPPDPVLELKKAIRPYINNGWWTYMRSWGAIKKLVNA